MAQEDKAYYWNRCWYIPFYVARLAAGPFLPASPNWVEQHLELHPGFRHGVIDRYSAGIRLQRFGLAAAQVHGDSMIDRKVFNGDIAIFQRRDYRALLVQPAHQREPVDSIRPVSYSLAFTFDDSTPRCHFCGFRDDSPTGHGPRIAKLPPKKTKRGRSLESPSIPQPLSPDFKPYASLPTYRR